MTDLALKNGLDLGTVERVIAAGDLSKLSPEERARYYLEVCTSLKLNPLTRPFEYLVLNGRLVLYARKDATDQLRSIHRISLEITSRETVGDLYVVTAKARTPDGRTDEEIGAVGIKGLAGDALANALMKCSTKAKRRVTLSVCGLGFLDESELDTVRDAVVLDTEPLPASTSGAAARLGAEIASLPASMDPDRTAALEDAKAVARGIFRRMKDIKPDTTVTLPDDDDPVEVWTSWVDTWGPTLDEYDRRRAARR